MRNKIAEIKLAPGQVGFYDELTNIHLTLTKPFAYVYQGMNTSGLQRSVSSKRLDLVWGSLRPAPIRAEEVFTTPVIQTLVEKVEAPVETETIEIVEAPVEQLIEDIVETTEEVIETDEVVEAPKKSTRKSSKKKEEVKEEE